MTDDPTAASDPARVPDALDDDRDSSDQGGGSQDEGDNIEAGEGSSSRPQQVAPRRTRRQRRSASKTRKIRRAKAGIAQKLEFMTHLMGSLDVAIIVELCTLYYMEYAPSSSPIHLIDCPRGNTSKLTVLHHLKLLLLRPPRTHRRAVSLSHAQGRRATQTASPAPTQHDVGLWRQHRLHAHAPSLRPARSRRDQPRLPPRRHYDRSYRPESPHLALQSAAPRLRNLGTTMRELRRLAGDGPGPKDGADAEEPVGWGCFQGAERCDTGGVCSNGGSRRLNRGDISSAGCGCGRARRHTRRTARRGRTRRY